MKVEDLFTDGVVSTPSGTVPEFIGTTLSVEDNKVSDATLLKYSKDNFSYARCIIDDKWTYAYNGNMLEFS